MEAPAQCLFQSEPAPASKRIDAAGGTASETALSGQAGGVTAPLSGEALDQANKYPATTNALSILESVRHNARSDGGDAVTVVESPTPGQSGEGEELTQAASQKTPAWSTTVGLQLPEVVQPKRGSAGKAYTDAALDTATAEVQAMHRFDAPMPFGKGVLRAKILAKEFIDPEKGTRLYHVEAVEIGAGVVGRDPKVSGQFPPGVVSLDVV